MTRSWILLIFASLIATGCSSGDSDSRGPAPDSTVTIEIPGIGILGGGFLLAVGPGDRADFRFSGEGPGRATLTSLTGQYRYTPENLVREQTGDAWISYRPSSEWDWLLENRGDLVLTVDSVQEWYKIRTFEYHARADDSVDVRLGCVAASRINYGARTIAAGDDLMITITGRLSGACFALDGTTVIDDPRHELNPLCRDLLSEGH